jgi:hypothetical protein
MSTDLIPVFSDHPSTGKHAVYPTISTSHQFDYRHNASTNNRDPIPDILRPSIGKHHVHPAISTLQHYSPIEPNLHHRGGEVQSVSSISLFFSAFLSAFLSCSCQCFHQMFCSAFSRVPSSIVFVESSYIRIASLVEEGGVGRSP